MATLSVTENFYSSYKSSWVATISAPNITARSSTTVMGTLSGTAKYTYSGKTSGYAQLQVSVFNGSSKLFSNDAWMGYPDTQSTLTSWSSGTTKTLNRFYDYVSGGTISTSSLFNSSNKTSHQVNLTLKCLSAEFFSKSNATNENGYSYGYSSTGLSMGTLCTVTLDVPPTYNSSITFLNGSTNANGNIYAGITKAKVTISNIEAYYEGYITRIQFGVGNQWTDIQYTENTQPGSSVELVIDPLNAANKFKPQVIVTDSRNQFETYEFDEIEVLPYECSVSAPSAVRVNSTTFVKEDEGTCAVLKATFTHTHFTGSTLLQPDVTIAGISTPNITWYQGWNESTGAFSNQVTNWTSLSGTVDLYGKITNTFVKTNSYTITVTPKTTLNTTGGGSLSTTLAQSFYLLVGRPGGHGLGIGTKPPTDDLHVDMNAYFYKDIFMVKMAGVIQMYGGVNPPSGWLICDGRSLLISDYPLLAAALYDSSTSTYIYGAADSTHFNLPDLRGRAPIGAGQGTGLTDRALGTQDIGSETHTLTEAQLPKITGSFILRHWASSTSNVIFSTSGKFTTTNVGSDANNVANNSSNPKNAQQVTYAFGGNGAHPNMQPSAVVNFIICTGKTS